ncbi:MAG: ribosome small subunit-dependent GTPase A [Actinobacteria bacterium]|nr:ribosome small subunit-dependent GTPase A [Actinomycetota bacterium]
MQVSNRLYGLGWDEQREHELKEWPRDMLPGRVLVEHRGAYSVLTARGQLWAQPTGRMRHEAESRADLPATGDWVVAEVHDEDRASIRAVLPRRTSFSRNIAGKATEEQVLAANVDVSFLIASLEHEVNLRRIERYLTLAWSGGTDPVIVLAKSDLAGDPEDIVYELERVESIALGVPVLLTSSFTGAGIEDVRDALAGSRTGVLLGSSGAGKSSLVNALVGDAAQQVHKVRGDGKGRHTTTRRELIALPGGGVLIDTPGLRGLKLWDHGEGVASTFGDVADLALDCKFNDCRHETEPGCAVLAAIADGSLDEQRLADWRKLQRELEYQRSKQDQRLAMKRKQQWKTVQNSVRKVSW